MAWLSKSDVVTTNLEDVPAGPSLLSRDEILSANDLGYEDVPVPEWGGTVRIKALDGRERDDFEASIAGTRNKLQLRNVRARLAALCIVDANGNLLFSPEDVRKLGHKSAAALDRVFSAAQKLNGLTDEDIDELEKD